MSETLKQGNFYFLIQDCIQRLNSQHRAGGDDGWGSDLSDEQNLAARTFFDNE